MYEEGQRAPTPSLMDENTFSLSNQKSPSYESMNKKRRSFFKNIFRRTKRESGESDKNIKQENEDGDSISQTPSRSNSILPIRSSSRGSTEERGIHKNIRSQRSFDAIQSFKGPDNSEESQLNSKFDEQHQSPYEIKPDTESDFGNFGGKYSDATPPGKGHQEKQMGFSDGRYETEDNPAVMGNQPAAVRNVNSHVETHGKTQFTQVPKGSSWSSGKKSSVDMRALPPFSPLTPPPFLPPFPPLPPPPPPQYPLPLPWLCFPPPPSTLPPLTFMPCPVVTNTPAPHLMKNGKPVYASVQVPVYAQQAKCKCKAPCEVKEPYLPPCSLQVLPKCRPTLCPNCACRGHGKRTSQLCERLCNPKKPPVLKPCCTQTQFYKDVSMMSEQTSCCKCGRNRGESKAKLSRDKCCQNNSLLVLNCNEAVQTDLIDTRDCQDSVKQVGGNDFKTINISIHTSPKKRKEKSLCKSIELSPEEPKCKPLDVFHIYDVKRHDNNLRIQLPRNIERQEEEPCREFLTSPQNLSYKRSPKQICDVIKRQKKRHETLCHHLSPSDRFKGCPESFTEATNHEDIKLGRNPVLRAPSNCSESSYAESERISLILSPDKQRGRLYQPDTTHGNCPCSSGSGKSRNVSEVYDTMTSGHFETKMGPSQGRFHGCDQWNTGSHFINKRFRSRNDKSDSEDNMSTNKLTTESENLMSEDCYSDLCQKNHDCHDTVLHGNILQEKDDTARVRKIQPGNMSAVCPSNTSKNGSVFDDSSDSAVKQSLTKTPTVDTVLGYKQRTCLNLEPMLVDFISKNCRRNTKWPQCSLKSSSFDVLSIFQSGHISSQKVYSRKYRSFIKSLVNPRHLSRLKSLKKRTRNRELSYRKWGNGNVFCADVSGNRLDSDTELDCDSFEIEHESDYYQGYICKKILTNETDENAYFDLSLRPCNEDNSMSLDETCSDNEGNDTTGQKNKKACSVAACEIQSNQDETAATNSSCQTSLPYDSDCKSKNSKVLSTCEPSSPCEDKVQQSNCSTVINQDDIYCFTSNQKSACVVCVRSSQCLPHSKQETNSHLSRGLVRKSEITPLPNTNEKTAQMNGNRDIRKIEANMSRTKNKEIACADIKQSHLGKVTQFFISSPFSSSSSSVSPSRYPNCEFPRKSASLRCESCLDKRCQSKSNGNHSSVLPCNKRHESASKKKTVTKQRTNTLGEQEHISFSSALYCKTKNESASKENKIGCKQTETLIKHKQSSYSSALNCQSTNESASKKNKIRSKQRTKNLTGQKHRLNPDNSRWIQCKREDEKTRKEMCPSTVCKPIQLRDRHDICHGQMPRTKQRPKVDPGARKKPREDTHSSSSSSVSQNHEDGSGNCPDRISCCQKKENISCCKQHVKDPPCIEDVEVNGCQERPPCSEGLTTEESHDSTTSCSSQKRSLSIENSSPTTESSCSQAQPTSHKKTCTSVQTCDHNRKINAVDSFCQKINCYRKKRLLYREEQQKQLCLDLDNLVLYRFVDSLITQCCNLSCGDRNAIIYGKTDCSEVRRDKKTLCSCQFRRIPSVNDGSFEDNCIPFRDTNMPFYSHKEYRHYQPQYTDAFKNTPCDHLTIGSNVYSNQAPIKKAVRESYPIVIRCPHQECKSRRRVFENCDCFTTSGPACNMKTRAHQRSSHLLPYSSSSSCFSSTTEDSSQSSCSCDATRSRKDSGRPSSRHSLFSAINLGQKQLRRKLLSFSRNQYKAKMLSLVTSYIPKLSPRPCDVVQSN